MRDRLQGSAAVLAALAAGACVAAAEPDYVPGIEDRPLFAAPIDVHVPHVSSDSDVRVDYDIVYVRARRAGDQVHKRFYTDFSQPVTMEPGADLMLLHPDGREELLVPGGDGSITDPVVSYDGVWVYYVHLYDLRHANQWDPPAAGADKKHRGNKKAVVTDDGRVVFLDSDRRAVRTYWIDTYGRGNCPPGLAKKGNGCLPPGIAAKRYVVGRPLPRTVVVDRVPTVLVPRLRPAPAGYEYVIVDGDLVLMRSDSRLIADAIVHLFD